MRVKTKGILMLISMLFLTAVLSGCGGSSNADKPKESQPSNEASASQPVESDQGDAANDKAFTIRIGSWFIDDRSHQQGLKQAVEEEYKKLYPNGKIQWDITLGGTFADKLKAQFASDSAPDVTFYQALDYIKAGNFMELSNEPWVARLSDTAEKDTTTTMFEGKRYGVPMQGSTGGGVWYNKKMFEELGLKQPTTAQEFLDLCEQIRAAGKTPIAIGFKDAWTAQLFMFNWLQSYVFPSDANYGKNLFEGTVKFNDAAIQTVYKHFELMKKKGYFNKNALSIDWPQSSQLFSSGEAAMIVQGPWMPGTNADNIDKGGYENFEIGFFPLMDDKGNSSLQLSAGTGLAINANTKLVQESKDLVNIMTKTEILSPWLAGEGALPYFTDVEVKFSDPVMDTVKQYVDSGLTLPYRLDNFMHPSAMNAMVDVLTKVVSGVSFNPKDLNAAQDAFDKDKTSVVLP